MKNCEYCGSQNEDLAKVCSRCGAKFGEVNNNQVNQQRPQQTDYMYKAQNINNTTGNFEKNDIEQNKAMAVLSYFGILVLIPIFAAKESKFARFHANQGLLLSIAGFIYGIGYSVISTIALAISNWLFFIPLILGLVSIVFLVFSIIGIVNAAKGNAKELPIIGKIRLLK